VIAKVFNRLQALLLVP